MARRTVVRLEDDLEGGPADETFRFGVDGFEYEIDLNKKNAAALHKMLAPFVERARRAGSPAHRPVRTAASRRRSRDIRMWARDQGIELAERGRIPANVVDKYESAVAGASQRRVAGTRRRPRLSPFGQERDCLRALRKNADPGVWAECSEFPCHGGGDIRDAEKVRAAQAPKRESGLRTRLDVQNHRRLARNRRYRRARKGASEPARSEVLQAGGAWAERVSDLSEVPRRACATQVVSY